MFPENTVPSLEGHEFQESNSSKDPCATNHIGMRDDSLALTQEECQLSTSTSRGAFSQLYVCERDPEVVTSTGMNPKIP